MNFKQLFSSLLVLLCASLSAFAAEARRPNVLLIVSDDQAYSELVCFGNTEVRTPRLDRLASEGVRVTDFYVTWPACTPSRGSILTGRYPQRNGLYDMIRNDLVNYKHQYTPSEYAISPEMTLGMDLREVTIAQPLHAAGYACGAVGKWDGGRAKRFLPQQRGFDFFYGFANTGIDYWTHERYGVPSLFRGNELIKEEGYATDLFCREALNFIRANRERPFFLYVPFNAPHGASSFTDKTAQAPADEIAQYASIKAEGRRSKYACITHMDASIGQLLDELKALELEKDTLVIFFSDNGGGGQGATAKLRGTKNSLFQGGLRVPFIARWPGKIPAGAVRHEFLTALEVFPTLLAATGVSAPAGVKLDGFDMLPTLAGQQPSPRHQMYWQHQDDAAARFDNLKWVAPAAGAGGLFDLSCDEGEQHDLSSERPEVAAQLKARFQDWRAEMDASEPRGPFRDY
ncbi:MAG: sulfatase-like hydrolase/transferase [Planctomycetes bacterium]|nr:sulfatase-like hydrolase/transferase [Planctomycetota bacterium]